jgi:hypothetical protein
MEHSTYPSQNCDVASSEDTKTKISGILKW